MAININAKTTGVGGLETSADNSGNINIQSGGSTVMSVTSSGVAVTGSFSQNGAVYSTQPTFRNIIINGDMRIDQRNAGASVTPADGNYTIDRWATIATAASKFSIEQNAGSVTPPVGFSNYLGITSLSAYSVGAGDILGIQQRIEGFNTSNLDWGTANAKTVTLSAWVYSSLTGTFGGSIINAAQNYSYPFTYTISSANTWTKINVTISGPTSGTWVGATNGIGIQVNFGIGGGSTYSGTSGAWGSQQKYTATGATSVVGTNGATFYITGVQLEVGSTATEFEHLPYDVQLARCQRYYQRYVSDSNYTAFGSGRANTSTQGVFYHKYTTTMRSSPTIGQANTGINTPSQINATGLGTSYLGKDSAFVAVNVASGLTPGGNVLWLASNNFSAYVELNAEL